MYRLVFDKLWLENCINALFENVLKNDMLNLLYLENRNAQIAVKYNNQVSRRINVKFKMHIRHGHAQQESYG